MIPIGGRPFLAYLIDMLAAQGFDRILLLLGYLPEATTSYFRGGREFGVKIEYRVTPEKWQTGGRLQESMPHLDSHVLLAYCDNIWPLPFGEVWRRYCESGRPAQMTVYRNDDRLTRSNVKVSGEGEVLLYDAGRTASGLAGVDIGFVVASREALAVLPEAVKYLAAQRSWGGKSLPAFRTHRPVPANEPFERLLYPEWIRRGWLGAFETRHRYYSVGRPEQLRETEKFLAGGPVVLLDRDGVLNRKRPPGEYVRSWSEWEWEEGALDALRMFHEKGWRVAVVSNQAGIGRKAMAQADLDAIHDRMRREAEEAGGRIDSIFYCPHDWHAGCSCRKPEPGLLFQAQKKMHADLTKTYFLGDDERDREAARAAGCLFEKAGNGISLARLAERLIEAEERRCAY
jgi:D-glycero-D-manno-heptose 1,7-bisphosphate phosphatase